MKINNIGNVLYVCDAVGESTPL